MPSANRPSINHASAIITAPVVVIVNDTVWIRDGRLSSRTPNVGSCTTGLAPAPRAPIPIRTVPVAPNSRVRCSAESSEAFSGEPTACSSPWRLAIVELRVCSRAAISSSVAARLENALDVTSATRLKGTLGGPIARNCVTLVL